ncbi:CPBP family glutamic-type intramembrane protease [Enemella dayhoffiae]|uniref:CPBP family glutamic-type intramembrane protease n=1 Tax=Enemella dayhoffiae TaxID=2016507 RepID=UPI00113FD2B4|nr:CPBP family glutamic-type intramembrane protease [Enemella dayhoffiae]
MQRTNNRAVALFVILVLTSMVALCLPFLLTRTEVPAWLLLIGRWMPALVSLLVLKLAVRRGTLVAWWRLRPGGWRRLLIGYAAAVAVTSAVAVIVFGIGRLLGLIATAPELPGLLVTAATVLVTAALLSLSTLGEEVAWRAFLPQLLPGLGFWAKASSIGLFWMLWHVPLHASYVLAGVMPLSIAIVSTLTLLAVAPLWQALADRFGSVWPAVFAHAVPLTPLVLADLGAASVPGLVGYGLIWAVVSILATELLRTGRSHFLPQEEVHR